MSLEDEIFALEEQFWPGDAGFYRAHLDAQCAIAFTELAGVMAKDQIADMIKEPQQWRDLRLTRKGFYQPTKDVAIVVYEVAATRPNGSPHRAHVTSTYVDRGGAWKMAGHQQTPLPA
jgi:uncharacterized protein (DUF488 family)